ncbi:LLM class flavin-dependent oxidoreductase [Roseomonas sp. WA12]
MLQFGIFDHLDDSGLGHARQYEDRLQLAETCDAAGFRAYHVAEHHGTPHGIASSPSVFLSALAQRTKRLRFGTLVSLLTLQHPLKTFEETCMLDQISRGRVELGIGRGTSGIELRFFGVEVESAGDRFREAWDIIQMAMVGSPISYAGRFFQLRDVPVALSPFQSPRPPIWYGANNPSTAAWAARNGMNLASFGRVEKVRTVTDAYRANWPAGETGMPLLGMARHIVISQTDAEAEDLAKPAYASWYQMLGHLERQHGITQPPKAPPSFEEAMANGICIVGSVSTVREAIMKQTRSAGVTYLLCQVAFGNLPLAASLATVAAIRGEIMPVLENDISASRME